MKAIVHTDKYIKDLIDYIQCKLISHRTRHTCTLLKIYVPYGCHMVQYGAAGVPLTCHRVLQGAFSVGMVPFGTSQKAPL